jgi:hypothetical protein
MYSYMILWNLLFWTLLKCLYVAYKQLSVTPMATGNELSILAVENRIVIELFLCVVYKELSDSVTTHFKYNVEHVSHNNRGQSVSNLNQVSVIDLQHITLYHLWWKGHTNLGEGKCSSLLVTNVMMKQDFHLSLKVLQKNNSVCFCILEYKLVNHRKTTWWNLKLILA